MTSNRSRIKAKPLTQCASCPVRERALYQKIPKSDLNSIQEYRQHQLCLAPKTTLYTSGTMPPYIYTLYDGWLSLYQTSNTGKRQIVGFALPGDLLGFQANAKGKIMHSAITLTDATLCAFPRSRVGEMFNNHPMLATQVVVMESRELALCQHHLMSAGRKDAQESVAFLLLELFHRCRQQLINSFNADDNSVDFPLTQEDIGDAIGLTNVHVNRVIRQFTQDGLIECRHKKLRIIDEDRLSQIGEFDINIISSNLLS
ncbi:MAG TPA: Crp/Fnr family transcriptional regulator [Leucothrix mucor]|nr:Crp/Fnr family transcriptional regulator [Leucothrix mucor]